MLIFNNRRFKGQHNISEDECLLVFVRTVSGKLKDYILKGYAVNNNRIN